MANQKVINLISQIQGLVQYGKTYTHDECDMERYHILEGLTKEMIRELSNASDEQLAFYFSKGSGYATPKVDIRAVTFYKNKLLLVREKSSYLWSIPGGWSDIGYSPKEIAKKETLEEAELDVIPENIIAFSDMAKRFQDFLCTRTTL